MGKPANLRCFIIAPVDVDTSVLRTALEQRNVRWADATAAEPGSSILDTIESAIRRADFVCVVIPQGVRATNVYFELGLARGFRKPVLLFIEPGVDIATELAPFEYVRAAFTDHQAIAFNLDAFLEHFPRKPRGRPRIFHPMPTEINMEWAKDKVVALEQMPRGVAGQAFQELVASVFERTGAVVTRQPGRPERGVDMALWLDEVQSSLGNPLLVEVKLGRLTESKVAEVEEQLRTYISKTRAQAGLLVYLGREGQRFVKVGARWPLVFRFDVCELIELISRGELGKTLLAERNRAAHSGG